MLTPEPTPEASQWPWRPGWVDHCSPHCSCRDVLRLTELIHGAEQARTCFRDLPKRDNKTVRFAMTGHLDKRIIRDGAGILHARLQTPIPLIFLQSFELIESSAQ